MASTFGWTVPLPETSLRAQVWRGARVGVSAAMLLACFDFFGGLARGSLSVVDAVQLGTHLVAVGWLTGLVVGAVLGVVAWAVSSATSSIPPPRDRGMRALAWAAVAVAPLNALWHGFVAGRWSTMSTGRAFTHAVALGGLQLVTIIVVFWLSPWFEGHTEPSAGRYRRDGALAAAALLGAYYADASVMVGLYPRMHAALAVVAVLAAGVLFGLPLSMRPSRLSWRRFALLTAASFLALPGLGAASEHVRVAALRHTLVDRHVVRDLRDWADRDRDGFSVILGGGDCNDDDPSIHPGAVDLPENGIDEDCSGADLRLEDLAPAPTARPKTAGKKRKLNVVLVTIDTLRADHVGAYGYKRPTSPFLDELATSSWLYERAYAQSNDTGTSMPSMVCGRYPSTAPWQYPLRCERAWEPNRPIWPKLTHPSNVTLGQVLTKAGYRTGVVTAVPQLLDGEIAKGMATKEKPKDEDLYTRASAFVEAGAGPFFLWVHAKAPHAPYRNHPEKTFGSSDLDRYDSEIAHADRRLRAFWEGLGDARQADTMLVVSADHGEEFREHGGQFHTTTLYEEMIRVPLIIRVPDEPPARLKEPAELVDIMPTVLDVLGLEPPSGLDGTSLRPLGKEAPGIAYSERLHCGATHLRALVKRRWKLIADERANTFELFDLAADPGEKNNAIEQDTGVAAKMRQELTTFLLRKDLALLARARRGGDADAEQLAKNLASVRHAPLLREAAEVLGASKVDAAAPHMAAVARRDGVDAEVRASMVEGLGRLGTRAAIRELLALRDEGIEAERARARALLGKHEPASEVALYEKTRSLHARARKASSIDEAHRLYKKIKELDRRDREASRHIATLDLRLRGKVEFQKVELPDEAKANGAFLAKLRFLNAGDVMMTGTWRVSQPASTTIRAKWKNGEVAGEGRLPWLKQGNAGELRIRVAAPSEPGRHVLVFEVRHGGKAMKHRKAFNRVERTVRIVSP